MKARIQEKQNKIIILNQCYAYKQTDIFKYVYTNSPIFCMFTLNN